MGERAVEDWTVSMRQEDVGDLLRFLTLLPLVEVDHLVKGSLEISFEIRIGVDGRVGRATGLALAFVLDLLIRSRCDLLDWLLVGLGLLHDGILVSGLVRHGGSVVRTRCDDLKDCEKSAYKV